MITCEEKARVDSVCPKRGVCHPRLAIGTDKHDYLDDNLFYDFDLHLKWCRCTAAVRLGRSLEKAIAASFKVPSTQSQERQMLSRKRSQLCLGSTPIQQNPKPRLLSPNVS